MRGKAEELSCHMERLVSKRPRCCRQVIFFPILLQESGGKQPFANSTFVTESEHSLICPASLNEEMGSFEEQRSTRLDDSFARFNENSVGRALPGF